MGIANLFKMAEAMRSKVAELLQGIDRYNPANLNTLECYVDLQCRDNTYDLEANLAVLKLYQFNPAQFQANVVAQILLKALTNRPHTDFTLCKCLIDSQRLTEDPLVRIVELSDQLEACLFREFWIGITDDPELIEGITGFEENIRKFVCHVVNITFQTIKKEYLKEILGGLTDNEVATWITKYDWKDLEDGYVFIANQDANIKTKNITEKITFESV